jgi:hypothetical protein
MKMIFMKRGKNIIPLEATPAFSVVTIVTVLD